MQAKLATSDGDRVVRVFVSSTFRDMFEEREILVKRVFPALRKMCEERDVTWGEVDLRWGVPDEKKAEGKVLPICLEEIKRCSYFIGILGERYGSLPEELPQYVVDREPWLKEHLEHSLTELEIWHGVLNDPRMASRSFFYFRDSGYLDRLPKDANRADFAAESPQAAEKLSRLKNRIRDGGFKPRDYANPAKLAELVLDDLTKVINETYPQESAPDPLDREAVLHDGFARSRNLGDCYIGRKEYLERLDEHATGNGRPLVILGESGSGKSALLANWALTYRENHKDDLLILHFVGASPASSDWAAMLRRVMGEFKRKLGVQHEIPDRPEAVRSEFANWLYMAAAKGKVVLILDALNQLEDRDGAPDLAWLPPELPRNARLVVSTLPGRPLDELKTRNWPTLKVEPLTEDERGRFIRQYLDQYRKELSPAQVSRVAQAGQTANPLFLQALLEELRLFGKHDELESRINVYLGAKDARALYQLILERYEKDYDYADGRTGLVRDAMSAIWAARRGLSEAELLDILGKDGQPLPRASWSWLYLAADRSLVSRAELLGFSHDYFRTAVRDRYLSGESEQAAAHNDLADYFEKQEPGPRRTDELPWQLARAACWPRLSRLLSDVGFFALAWRTGSVDVMSYWALIEKNTHERALDAYLATLSTGSLDGETCRALVAFLRHLGHFAEVLPVAKVLAARYRQVNDLSGLQATLGQLSEIQRKLGDTDAAMSSAEEREAVSRTIGDVTAQAHSLIDKSVILAESRNLGPSLVEEKFVEAEKFFRQKHDDRGLILALLNQAVVLFDSSRLGRAEEILEEVEALCRTVGDMTTLAQALGIKANIALAKGEPSIAAELHENEALICRDLGDMEGVARVLSGEAQVAWERGDLNGAEQLIQKLEKISADMGYKLGVQLSLGNLGAIHHARGALDVAMKFYKRQEAICRSMRSAMHLQQCIGNQGELAHLRGDRDGALELLREQESICRKASIPDGLARALNDQAEILSEEPKSLESAEQLITHAMDEAGKHGLALVKQIRPTSVMIRARILNLRGDLGAALGLYKEAEQLYRETRNENGVQVCLGGQADVCRAQGRFTEAVTIYEEQDRLCREVGNVADLAQSLAYRALLLCDNLSRPAEALLLAEEAHRQATERGCAALAQRVRTVLDYVRAKLG